MNYDKIRYDRLKEAGLCPKCGKERDDPNYVSCTECRLKSQERKNQDYHWYVDNGICPYCKTNNLFQGEHACIECKTRKNIYEARYRAKNREEYNAHMRELNRIAYYKLRDAGLCVECRRKVEEPEKYAKCSWCRAKYRQIHAQKRLLVDKKPGKQQLWREAGLCYLCGEPLFEDHGLCKKHYEIMKERCGRKGLKKREQADRISVSEMQE